jgi:hypothetical protein
MAVPASRLRRRNVSKTGGPLFSNAERPRHLAALPEDRRLEQPFLFAGGDVLVAPWPRSSRLTDADCRRLNAVLAQVAQLEARWQPMWFWSDGRDPEPVQNAEPAWMRHWQRDRPAYTVPRPERRAG